MSDQKIKILLNKYTYIIEELKRNEVIRTSKVVADYGEYIASKRMSLRLVGNSVNKGYDAVDVDGKKYEIKTRKATAWNRPNVFPVNLNQLSAIDFLIYVEFNNKWSLVKLLKIPRNKIMPNRYNRVCITEDLVKKYSVL